MWELGDLPVLNISFALAHPVQGPPSPATTGRLLSWIESDIEWQGGCIRILHRTPFITPPSHPISNHLLCKQAYHHKANDQDVKLLKSIKPTRGKTQNVSGKKQKMPGKKQIAV